MPLRLFDAREFDGPTTSKEIVLFLFPLIDCSFSTREIFVQSIWCFLQPTDCVTINRSLSHGQNP
jgi:hypothetical protein